MCTPEDLLERSVTPICDELPTCNTRVLGVEGPIFCAHPRATAINLAHKPRLCTKIDPVADFRAQLNRDWGQTTSPSPSWAGHVSITVGNGSVTTAFPMPREIQEGSLAWIRQLRAEPETSTPQPSRPQERTRDEQARARRKLGLPSSKGPQKYTDESGTTQTSNANPRKKQAFADYFLVRVGKITLKIL